MGAMKQLLDLGGKPVLIRTLEVFEDHEEVDEIVVVASQEVAETIRSYGFKKLKSVVDGGPNRQASVWSGILALSPEVEWVLIHDGARPLVTWQVVSDVLVSVRLGKCAISGVKSKDTVKITDNGNIVQDTPDRNQAWLVQTPQGFPRGLIQRAHRLAIKEGFVGTDDAVLIERLGMPVTMVEGDYRNIKLTTPDDMRVAEALLSCFRFKSGLPIGEKPPDAADFSSLPSPFSTENTIHRNSKR